MAKKNDGSKHEKEQKKKRMLQREVLAHLKEHGPRNWEMLYVHFDQKRTANIATVLQDLREGKHIEVSKDDIVTITSSGLARLEEKEY
jgi:hypothetical protein